MNSTPEDGWDLLERCWWQYRALCLRLCGGRQDVADEMMGDVVDRLPRIVDTWNPTMGTLRGYAYRTLQRYLTKWMARDMKRKCSEIAQEPSTRDDETCFVEDLGDEILTMRFARDMGITEIAEELGVSLRMARRLLAERLEIARRKWLDGELGLGGRS